ncbi:glycosyl hydrolase family 18 protein [Longispora sp. NPDC051575]|uniref:chitinase n=1 Tax=Longispora sp. NPDC051575 TaxID=3154943 RepID=UPI0034456294
MRRATLATAVTAAALAVGLAIPALASTTAPLAAPVANNVTNPGFETGTLAPWTCDPAASVVTGHANSGTYALAGVAGGTTAECRQTVSVAPNTSYTLSAQVNGSYVYLGITGGASTWTPGTGGAYKPLSLTFTSGSATTVTVYLHGWYGQGTYYADDVNLAGPAGPSPTASPKPTASPTKSPTPSPSPTASPTPSPSPTPTPTGNPNPGPLPKHALTGYWQNFTNGARPLKLADVPVSYDLVAISFADTDPSKPGGVTFTLDSGLSSALGGYTDAQFRADVATLHARGQHIVLSVGGEKGTVSVNSAAAATNFANSVTSILTRYGFDGVDIDLENGVSATYMGQALRSIRASVGANLIITMAPQTIDMQSTGSEYFKLALNIKDILTVVHTQFYNSGAMLGCDQMAAYSQGTVNFVTALACIQLQSALRPDQIALGLPATTSAAGGGYLSPGTINNAVDCLAKGTNCGTFKPPATWPGLRGVMTWSINWDASNGYAFANSVKPHLNTLP